MFRNYCFNRLITPTSCAVPALLRIKGAKLEQVTICYPFGEGKIVTIVLCVFSPLLRTYDILTVLRRPSANSFTHSG